MPEPGQDSAALNELVNKKLDTITDILLRMARQEEKVINLAAQDDRHEKRMDVMDGRVKDVELQFNGPDGLHARHSKIATQMAVVVLVGVGLMNYFMR